MLALKGLSLNIEAPFLLIECPLYSCRSQKNGGIMATLTRVSTTFGTSSFLLAY